MGKGPGLYTEIGKKARDLLYKDYQSDHKFSITTYSSTGVVELQYLHDYAGISTSVGLTANPIVNFSGLVGTNLVAFGTDLSFDSKTGNFTKCNAGLSFSNADLVASLSLDDKGDSLGASYYHIINPLRVVGAEVTHSFLTAQNTITVGSQYSTG